MSKRSLRLLAVLLVGAAVGGTGCASETPVAAKKPSPAQLEPIDGTTIKRVVLVPRAVERLDIQTVAVRSATPQEMAGVTPAGQGGRTVVPYDALVYDKAGAPFAYTNPKGLEYVRQAVILDGIKNKLAIVSAGPATGTNVVIVGAMELYGVETGVGK